MQINLNSFIHCYSILPNIYASHIFDNSNDILKRIYIGKIYFQLHELFLLKKELFQLIKSHRNKLNQNLIFHCGVTSNFQTAAEQLRFASTILKKNIHLRQQRSNVPPLINKTHTSRNEIDYCSFNLREEGRSIFTILRHFQQNRKFSFRRALKRKKKNLATP